MAKKISADLKAKLRKAREKFSKAEAAQTNDVVNRKVPDGTYTVPVSGLEYDTLYTWEVTAFDGAEYTTATYTFTTMPQYLVDSDFEASTDSADLRANAPEQDWYESRNDDPFILYLDESDIGGNTGKKAAFTSDASGPPGPP